MLCWGACCSFLEASAITGTPKLKSLVLEGCVALGQKAVSINGTPNCGYANLGDMAWWLLSCAQRHTHFHTVLSGHLINSAQSLWLTSCASNHRSVLQ
jgi:hypothetical protein